MYLFGTTATPQPYACTCTVSSEAPRSHNHIAMPLAALGTFHLHASTTIESSIWALDVRTVTSTHYIGSSSSSRDLIVSSLDTWTRSCWLLSHERTGAHSGLCKRRRYDFPRFPLRCMKTSLDQGTRRPYRAVYQVNETTPLARHLSPGWLVHTSSSNADIS